MNQFPEVASFVRDRGQADRYDKLKIKYIDHHNPDVVLFDKDGHETTRIDLTRVQTLENMHKLMLLLGLSELCRDLTAECAVWKRKGECDMNPVFMKENCRRSCDLCSKDAKVADVLCSNMVADSDCEYWSTTGECDANPAFMRSNCAAACGYCPGSESSEDEPKDEL